MPTVPFRNLASKGIIKDLPPYQLDLSSFSDGSNVLFHGGLLTRAPTFRTVYDNLPFIPLSILGVRPPTGNDQVFMLGPNQVCYRLSGGSLTNVTPASYTPASTANGITSAILAQVVYLNDPANTPFYYGPSSSLFAALPGWDSTWRCRSLRAFQDYMVALNVTKGAVQSGNMVKWSDLALNGLPPGSWDHTDPTKSAGENPLEALSTPLVDGLGLRNAFVLYSNDEVWAMETTGNDAIFTFRALFHSGGMISQNCGAEVDGKHYVFGPNDIYVHNGVSKTSLVDGKNRKYIFGNLDTAKASVCFTAYLPRHNAIIFGYPTGASESAVTPGNGCNKGAILDIASGAMTFVDLPNVHGVSEASVLGSSTYATISGTYETLGGSYWDLQSTIDAHIVMASEALSGSLTYSRVLGYDFNQKGNLPLPLCPEAGYPAFVERSGIDLDDVGSEVVTAKILRRLLPQARVYGDSPLSITAGSGDYPDGPYRANGPWTFDPRTQYKVDTKGGGRYLSVRFTQTSQDDFDLSGFDADIIPNGSR